MLHKSFEIVETKADGQSGTFEATVAVFGNVDKGGDRILPGAFDNTLAKWRETGDPIPIILSHQWDNPMAHIGVADPNDVTPTTKGLHVRGTLDINDNEVARQVHRLMSRRSLKEFSFGYSVPKGGEKRAKDGANDLSEIDLAEVGPTLKGMNPATELHSVKTALDEKASGMAGLMEAMRGLLAQEAAPTADDMLAFAERVVNELGSKNASGEEKAEEAGKETKSRSVDPLRKQAESLALEYASDGLSLRKPPRKVEQPTPKPELDLGDLKRRMRDEMLRHLSGDII